MAIRLTGMHCTTNALKHLTDQDLSQNWVGLDRKKIGKQTYTDYVVLAIWAIWGQNFGRPVIKMVANATGRVLILLPGLEGWFKMRSGPPYPQCVVKGD